MDREATLSIYFLFPSGAPREIRTPVLALKGLRPGPLDDGGEGQYSNITHFMGQGFYMPDFMPHW
jgi:hypothetical protein